MKDKVMPILKILFFASIISLSIVRPAVSAIIVFQDDFTGFEDAGGVTGIAIDFDSIAPGTILNGSTIKGVTFSSPPGNSLVVVEASTTFTSPGFTGVIDASTNVLPATSDDNVLSPGGPALVPGPDLAEEDSLLLHFETPLRSFGIDLLAQSLDRSAFVSFHLFDSSSNLLKEGSVNFSGDILDVGNPGGAFFMGFVSDNPEGDIASLLFFEHDGDATFPDSNVGYDTLRFDAVAPSVTLLWALATIGVLRSRRRRS